MGSTSFTLRLSFCRYQTLFCLFGQQECDGEVRTDSRVGCYRDPCPQQRKPNMSVNKMRYAKEGARERARTTTDPKVQGEGGQPCSSGRPHFNFPGTRGRMRSKAEGGKWQPKRTKKKEVQDGYEKLTRKRGEKDKQKGRSTMVVANDSISDGPILRSRGERGSERERERDHAAIKPLEMYTGLPLRMRNRERECERDRGQE